MKDAASSDTSSTLVRVKSFLDTSGYYPDLRSIPAMKMTMKMKRRKERGEK